MQSAATMRTQLQTLCRPNVRTFIRSSKPTDLVTEVKPTTKSEKFRAFVSSRRERAVNYFHMVKGDYKEAFKEVAEFYRFKPLKASIYSSIGLLSLYASYTNPDEMEFKDCYISHGHELAQVGDPIRNPFSQNIADYVSKAHNAGLIRRLNFGVGSIMWVDDYDKAVGLYAAQCHYIQPSWSDMSKRIVDVGFLGKWWISSRKMENYDINETEWDENGRPVNQSQQLKPMWG